MSKSGSPDWILTDEWAVSRNAYNWILMKPKGKRWRAVSFYPNPELLLKSLHRKILRTDPAQPDLAQHLKVCLNVAEACSDRFKAQLEDSYESTRKTTLNQALPSSNEGLGT